MLLIETFKEWRVYRRLYKMNYVSRVGPELVSKQANVCVFQNRSLRFLTGCRRRRLSQGLVVALDFLSVLDRACFLLVFGL